MKRSPRWITFLVLSIFTFSCSLLKIKPSAGESSPSSPSATGSIDLSVYQENLTQGFNGTQLGKPSQWSRTYQLNVMQDPNTRWMNYQETGLDPQASLFPAMVGFMSGVTYTRSISSSPCVASFSEAGLDPLITLPELADQLPKVTKKSPAGSQDTINGIPVQPYTFDGSDLKLDAKAQAVGKLWLAVEGGYLVKYSLSITGGNDFFDPDTSGTFTWEYRLVPVSDDQSSILPLDCPLPLPDLPLLPDASNQVTFPGYLGYETGSDPQAVMDFYKQSLPADRFTLVDDIRQGTQEASMIYSAGDLNLTFLAESGPPTRVQITGQSKQQAMSVTPMPTPDLSAQSTQIAGSPQMRVINSLGLLLGQDPTPSVFSSYHLESNQRSPRWDENSSQAITPESWLSIDVAGKDYHFFDSSLDKNGVKQTSEVYMIADQEYEVQNGVPTVGFGLASLAWVMWPLDPLLLLGVGSTKAEPVGTDTVDGRPVEVFHISGTTADDPSGLYAGFGSNVTFMDGKVWVDSQTGALLKTTLDYESQVKDGNGTLQGALPGHLELVVSRVNNVTVQLP